MSEKIMVYMNLCVMKDIAEEVVELIEENDGTVVSIEPATKFDIVPTNPESQFNKFAIENDLYRNIIFSMEQDKKDTLETIGLALCAF